MVTLPPVRRLLEISRITAIELCWLLKRTDKIGARLRHFRYMKYLLAVLISIGVAGAFFALIFRAADRDASMTLAELTAPAQNMAENPGNHERVQTAADGHISLASLDVDAIFYAVLGACAVLLLFRVVVLRVRTRREERLLARRLAFRSDMGITPSKSLSAERNMAPVFAPDLTEPDLEQRSSSAVVAKPRAACLREYLAHCTHGLTGKMIIGFSGMIAAFGLVAVAFVYFTLSASLNKHVMQRVRVVALNVSDGAPGYLLKKNAVGLREILRKHANRPELAYILVENRGGEIFAHSFAVLPEEIRGRAAVADQPAESQRVLRLGNADVYEVSAPILEGRNGTVRIGVWRDHVDAEINETLIPLIRLLALATCGGILAVVFLTWRINRPIFRLVAAAKAISSGDLDTPSPNVGDAGEFGELSRAIERMRSSVKAAMIRLSR